MLRGLDGEQAIQLQIECEICFWSLDLVTRTCQVGPGWQRWLGQAPELNPSNLNDWLDMVHPVDRAEIETLWQLPPSGRVFELTVRLSHGDGTWRWIRFKGRALEEGQLVRGLAEEITRQKGHRYVPRSGVKRPRKPCAAVKSFTEASMSNSPSISFPCWSMGMASFAMKA